MHMHTVELNHISVQQIIDLNLSTIFISLEIENNVKPSYLFLKLVSI